MPGMLKAHKADSAVIKKKTLAIKENEFALYQLTNAQENGNSSHKEISTG